MGVTEGLTDSNNQRPRSPRDGQLPHGRLNSCSLSCSSCVKGSCFKGLLAKEPYQMSSGNPGKLHQQASMWIKGVDLNPPKHFTCVRRDPTLLNPPSLFPMLLLTLSSLFLLFVAVTTCFSVNIRMDPQRFNELLWPLLHSFKHQISGCI